MEASHPTRDASITRVINAPASHRCTRSLEIGLFNGKACNDPRWRGRNEKECCTLASFLRKKKKLYSFISIRLSLSLSLYFSMRFVARVKGWKLKSVFFFWGEVVHACYYFHTMHGSIFSRQEWKIGFQRLQLSNYRDDYDGETARGGIH